MIRRLLSIPAESPQLRSRTGSMRQLLFTPTRKPLQSFRFRYSTSSKPKDAASRADRILSRLPRSMQKYTTRLRNAPVSHVVAFLILHELTAIIPLFGLFGLFHYTDYVPLGYMMEHYGTYVQDGVKRFEKYFKRKGWFGFGDEQNGEAPGSVAEPGQSGAQNAVMEKWSSDETKYKVVVEVALAYAITKALLPLRILGSLWATPWFAGVLVTARQLIGRKS